MASSAPTPFRQLFETRFSQLALDAESLFVEARDRARRDVAEQLNQAVRRLRQSADREELAATLVNAASPFATAALFFRVADGVAKSEKVEVALDSAAGLAGAIETRDPVIAAATPGEVSAELVDLLGHAPEDRVSIFPLVVKESVPALLYAWGTVESAALELLTQAGAAMWGALEPPPAPAPPLVQLAPAPVEKGKASTGWDSLPPEEQRLHLQAQRFARVQVAELRLFEGAAVQAGRAQRNLYDALRKPLDASRAAFREKFFTTPSMVDYLHLEVVHNLANDDADLLGKDYPGPLV